MIKSIIFDFDGVILESANLKTKAFQILFEKNYPEYIDKIIEYHNQNMGISRFVKFRYFYENFFKKPYSDDIEEQLGNRFSEIVLNEILKVPFVNGAYEFIESNKKNYTFFIASGSEENELKYISKKRNIYEFFLEIHGGHKEKHVIINDILLRYHYKKNEILFIGDAKSDVKAAEILNLPFFIARIDGVDSLLQECKYKINDLTELTDKINKINNS